MQVSSGVASGTWVPLHILGIVPSFRASFAHPFAIRVGCIVHGAAVKVGHWLALVACGTFPHFCLLAALDARGRCLVEGEGGFPFFASCTRVALLAPHVFVSISRIVQL